MRTQGLVANFAQSYYIINLQQRLQRQCHTPFRDSEGSDIVVRAADNVSDLVDDSLLTLSPERFPMIYISAIFTAMTAYVADYDTSSSLKGVQLSRRLRPNVLALRQLEQCYTIARWVRNLFMEIMDRHQRQAAADRGPGEEKDPPQEPSSRTTRYWEHSRPPSTDALMQEPAVDTSSAQGLGAVSGHTADSIEGDPTYLYDPNLWSHSSPSTGWASAMTTDCFRQSLPPSGYLATDQDTNWLVDATDLASLNRSTPHQSFQFLANLGLAGLNYYDCLEGMERA